LLDDAVAAFLDVASERALDEPLMAVLRNRGYSHVALMHGPQEWGKDIVARKDDEQWVFQSKAGDVGQAAWRQMTGQLDELRLSNYGGPEFDRRLPRRCVLILSGRLVGNSPLAAAEYNERAVHQGTPTVEIWNRDWLLGELSGNPDAVLRGSIDGALLTIMGAAERHQVDMATVERFARRWDAFPDERLPNLAIVEATLVAATLAKAERLDLACHAALCLAKAAWAGASLRPSAAVAADAGRALFRLHAEALWLECDERLLDALSLARISGPSAWITYPVKCLRIAEILGLYGLLLDADVDGQGADIAEWLAGFRRAQPGTAHVVGDLYAVSVIPMALLLDRYKPQDAEDLLEEVTAWLCDQLEVGRGGLAGSNSTPDEEIERLFGTPLEHVQVTARRTRSLLAAVLLDLSLLLERPRLYADIRNDLEAVGAVPVLLACPDDAGQYSIVSDNNRWVANPPYPDALPLQAGREPTHLRSENEDRCLLRSNRSWDLLAVSSALRDRYFTGAARRQRGRTDHGSSLNA
jgi:hypothetical protein